MNKTDTLRYSEIGKKCVLWDQSTKDMDREELLAFIGFLDEQLWPFIKEKIDES